MRTDNSVYVALSSVSQSKQTAAERSAPVVTAQLVAAILQPQTLAMSHVTI